MKRAAYALLLVTAGAAHAMTDPTKPPAAFANPDTTAPARAAPALQSIIITGANRVAIIDGERVEIGGRIGDAQVVSIAEDHVVLREHGVTQVLRLYPAIEKKTVRRDAPPAKTLAKGKP